MVIHRYYSFDTLIKVSSSSSSSSSCAPNRISLVPSKSAVWHPICQTHTGYALYPSAASVAFDRRGQHSASERSGGRTGLHTTCFWGHGCHGRRASQVDQRVLMCHLRLHHRGWSALTRILQCLLWLRLRDQSNNKGLQNFVIER